MATGRKRDEKWLKRPREVEFRPNKGLFGEEPGKVEPELGQSLRNLAKL